jgi:hypothetical protein
MEAVKCRASLARGTGNWEKGVKVVDLALSRA